MKKVLKCVAVAVVAFIVIYNMVYFKKLDEVKASANKTFDAEGYAKTFMTKKLPVAESKAIEINALLAQLKSDPHDTFDAYGHALAIGSTRFFMVKGKGIIDSVTYDVVQLKTGAEGGTINIATEFVFGNAIRDASNQVNINDFTNTIDLSNVSADINKIIRTKVLPRFKEKAKKGDKVEFTGAIELNSAHLSIDDVEVIPATLKLNP